MGALYIGPHTRTDQPRVGQTHFNQIGFTQHAREQQGLKGHTLREVCAVAYLPTHLWSPKGGG